MQHRAILRLATLLLLVVILYFALEPRPPKLFDWSDKTEHILAFLALASCARLAWARAHPLLLFVLITGFGAAIELAQWTMGLGRQADMKDWVADVFATVAGLAAAEIFLWLWRPAEAEEAAQSD